MTDPAPSIVGAGARGGRTDELLPLVITVLRPAEVTELRRRVAALPADCDTGLDRSTAYDVLSQLAELQARRKHGPNHVHCPYCGEGFDIAHGVTTRPPGWRNPPPRHPDPVGSSSTLAGAEAVTRALATAMAWGSDRLLGKDAFWVDFGRIVVWPLLFLANATGRDVEELRLWTHPMRVAETMATVATELEALAPGADADRARRQWARIAGQREQAQRTGLLLRLRDDPPLGAFTCGPRRGQRVKGASRVAGALTRAAGPTPTCSQGAEVRRPRRVPGREESAG